MMKRKYLIKKLAGVYCVFTRMYFWQKWKLMKMADDEYSDDIFVVLTAFKKRNLAKRFKLEIEL